MTFSIYDDLHIYPNFERCLSKEIEEIWVEEHGIEPLKKHVLIFMKLGKH